MYSIYPCRFWTFNPGNPPAELDCNPLANYKIISLVQLTIYQNSLEFKSKTIKHRAISEETIKATIWKGKLKTGPYFPPIKCQNGSGNSFPIQEWPGGLICTIYPLRHTL